MAPLSEAERFPQGCRVIAFDRPPFGLTERPLQWSGGDALSPYTSEVPHRPMIHTAYLGSGSPLHTCRGHLVLRNLQYAELIIILGDNLSRLHATRHRRPT